MPLAPARPRADGNGPGRPVRVGDRRRGAPHPAGDVYLIPSGVEHSATAVGGPARALDIFSPPRDEYKQLTSEPGIHGHPARFAKPPSSCPTQVRPLRSSRGTCWWKKWRSGPISAGPSSLWPSDGHRSSLQGGDGTTRTPAVLTPNCCEWIRSSRAKRDRVGCRHAAAQVSRPSSSAVILAGCCSASAAAASCGWGAAGSLPDDSSISRPRRAIRSAATSSAIGPRPTPTTPGTCRVGAVHPRSGGLRHQRRRADPAALRRRRRQPALPAAADGDDGRDVADRWTTTAWTSGSGIRRWTATTPTRRPCEFALKEWGEVFRQLPRIDAVFVPGGDPGHTQPKYLMALLEKQTAVAAPVPSEGADVGLAAGLQRRSGWTSSSRILQNEQPAWLGGVVFGPQVRMPLPELRKAVPAQYPIRDYPDITHSRQCQYPVPDWDLAFALTEGREVINPRPLGRGADLPALSAARRSASSPTPKAATTT